MTNGFRVIDRGRFPSNGHLLRTRRRLARVSHTIAHLESVSFPVPYPLKRRSVDFAGDGADGLGFQQKGTDEQRRDFGRTIPPREPFDFARKQQDKKHPPPFRSEKGDASAFSLVKFVLIRSNLKESKERIFADSPASPRF